jgi:branched-chain amino acid transport system substrate-binding protein
VIPSDDVQAQAAAVWAKRLGARQVAISADGSQFGKVMEAAFDEQARTQGLRVSRKSRFLLAQPSARSDVITCPPLLARLPDLVYAAGDPKPTGLPSPCARTLKTPLGLIAPDSLLTGRALPAVRGVDRPVRVTSATQDPEQLPHRGQAFARRFAARYGRRPGRYAAYGYEAMAVIIDSIRRAGDSGDDRDAVVEAFFDTANRDSVLGPYSIDDAGNTTLDRLTGYRVRKDRPVFDMPISVP